jgi:hypothetical protein
MLDEIYSNRIIKHMLLKTAFTENDLKKIYREFCKKTHPDLTGKNSTDFIILQKEYEEAKNYLSNIKLNLKLKTSKDSRKLLFKNLCDYNAYGLHSSRIRHNQILKDRNNELIKEILIYANQYDKEFVKIFLFYNEVHIKKLDEWEIEKKMNTARKIFLKGLNNFLDYQATGNPNTKKISISFINETIHDLNLLTPTSIQKAIIDYCSWLLKEIDLPPAIFDK